MPERIVPLALIWAATFVAVVWIIADSIYGDHRLPGIKHALGFFAYIGWIVAACVPAVVVSALVTS